MGSANTPSSASWSSLFAFTCRQHSPVLLVAIASASAIGGLKVAFAVILGKIFQVVTNYGNGSMTGDNTLSEVSFWCLALCALGMGTWLANMVFLSSWIVFGELQAKSVRDQMFRALLDKEMEWYDHQTDGTTSLLIRIET
jgi:ATP-binding cassette, subfamily B (MDR/TAP), member 1